VFYSYYSVELISIINSDSILLLCFKVISITIIIYFSIIDSLLAIIMALLLRLPFINFITFCFMQKLEDLDFIKDLIIDLIIKSVSVFVIIHVNIKLLMVMAYFMIYHRF